MAQPRQETQRKAKAGDSAAAKVKQLESFSQGPESQLTTTQGVPIPDNHNSLTAGGRGPTLLDDFILREKITHFDNDRIPDRVRHPRETGAGDPVQARRDHRHRGLSVGEPRRRHLDGAQADGVPACRRAGDAVAAQWPRDRRRPERIAGRLWRCAAIGAAIAG